MRFIGNKDRLIDRIYETLDAHKVSGETFYDFFAGTATVGRYFKEKGYNVCSSDIMYFSYCLQRAYIQNNDRPTFEKLFRYLKLTDNNQSAFEVIIAYLNDIKPAKGFIYQHYSPQGSSQLASPRMYFSNENAKKIDAIRQTIEHFNEENLLTEDEYFVLIACLVESVGFYSNIAGVYAAYHKKWDPRAVKPFTLRAIVLSTNYSHAGKAYNLDSMDMLDSIDVDILYLDPPYNARQYAPNYHILETIAKYDNPDIKGMTGMRDYKEQKSTFCNAKTAISDLDKIAKTAKFKYLLLSYNNECIMLTEDILRTLGNYGKTDLVEYDYRRFKSNNNGEGKTQKHIKEQLYILKKS